MECERIRKNMKVLIQKVKYILGIIKNFQMKIFYLFLLEVFLCYNELFKKLQCIFVKKLKKP